MRPVEDLGAPASYLTLEEHTPVYTSDGEELGKVAQVTADQSLDVFEGIVVRERDLPPAHRFVDAEKIDEIYEHGVVLKISAEEAEALPEPSGNK
jgi:uncharacterized protein YrrD